VNYPLVTIIIPNYNREKFIGEALDSILSQTYQNWECLVIDDGSTDNSKEVVRSYELKDSRIKLYERPVNRIKGANACRNYGFELSNGEYINWFDSDDIMMPEKLDVQVSLLHNSNYDFTVCQTMMFDMDKNKEIGIRARRVKSNNVFEDYILFKIFWLTGAPLWKKDFIQRTGVLFDEKLQQSQDYDFHMRILDKSENYLPLESVFVVFRLHRENMSIDTFDTNEKIYSNIIVKSNILKKYEHKLKFTSRIFVYNQLVSIYKECSERRKLSISLFALKTLLLNIGKLGLSFKDKLRVAYTLMFFLFVRSVSLQDIVPVYPELIKNDQ
jgi:glycosyltransferase involved in cell wall biosynthesis